MKILLAQPIPLTGIELLQRQGYEVDIVDHKLSREELIKCIHNADALICATHKIDEEIISAGNKLKVISKLAVGFDDIDIKFAGQRGIVVANTPGVMAQAVAELAFAHMLSLVRRIGESDRYIRSGNFKDWSFNLMVGSELRGKALGVIGFGSIGQNLIPIAEGFGMKVLYNNQKGELDKFKDNRNVRFATLDVLLTNSDFVVTLLPLTDKTQHLITYAELSLMKPSAFIINVARGKIIKEDDLVRALKEKKIAGAGLDVYEFEPKVNEELLAMSNTVLTSHVGGATVESRANLSILAASNVMDVLEGRDCKNIVNKNYLKLPNSSII